jgi:hypothetical protein
VSTAKPEHPFEKLLARLVPPPSSPAEQQAREALLDAIHSNACDLFQGKPLDTGSILRAARDILAALATNPGAVPSVLPLSAQGTLTITGTLNITLPRVTASATGHVAPVEVELHESGSAADSLTVERIDASGLSHKQKLLLLRIQILAVVFFALFGVVAANEELADKMGPYTGVSALGIAWWCSKQVARAYDKKYNPNQDDEAR